MDISKAQIRLDQLLEMKLGAPSDQEDIFEILANNIDFVKHSGFTQAEFLQQYGLSDPIKYLEGLSRALSRLKNADIKATTIDPATKIALSNSILAFNFLVRLAEDNAMLFMREAVPGSEANKTALELRQIADEPDPEIRRSKVQKLYQKNIEGYGENLVLYSQFITARSYAADICQALEIPFEQKKLGY